MKKIFFGMYLLLFSVVIYIAEINGLWLFYEADILALFISIIGLVIATFGLFDRDDK